MVRRKYGSPKPSQVETYCGSRLHERPRRFTWEGQWLEVRKVLSGRREPERLCFRVLADDGRNYLLLYHLSEDSWQVTEY